METVNDIINEIREIAHNISIADEKTLSMFRPVAAFARIADRLDAAYKRDMQAIVDANETTMKAAIGEVTRLREENERLKAALKPVLENVDTDYYTLSNAEDALDACKKAQSIYNGGAK